METKPPPCKNAEVDGQYDPSPGNSKTLLQGSVIKHGSPSPTSHGGDCQLTSLTVARNALGHSRQPHETELGAQSAVVSVMQPLPSPAEPSHAACWDGGRLLGQDTHVTKFRKDTTLASWDGDDQALLSNLTNFMFFSNKNLFETKETRSMLCFKAECASIAPSP